MAIVTHECPHWRTAHIGLRVAAILAFDAHRGAVHFDCPKCNQPSCAIMVGNCQVGMGSWGSHAGDVAQLNWTVEEFWPKVEGPLIPENLPPDVERVYLQAERNFPIIGNEEAAGTMYRKALDVGLKIIDHTITGNLKERIAALVAQNFLTQSLGEWANQIRLLGNDIAHEIDQPTRDEIEALRNFSDLVLRYLFTLPA